MKKASVKIFSAILSAAICLSAAGCSLNGGSPVPDGGSGETERLSEEEAKTVALNHAGVNGNEVTFTAVKLDRENGVYEYELEFVTDTAEYEYNIGINGEILSYSTKLLSSAGTAPSVDVGQTAPDNKETASEGSGESAAEITSAKTESEVLQSPPLSDETASPETFSSGGSGEWASDTAAVYPDGTFKTVSENEAKAIALNHAEVAEDRAVFTEIELDCEYDRDFGNDGHRHNTECKYEIEFISGNMEYEYEICVNGEILECHFENKHH